MKFKTTIILLLLVLAVGGYIYFVDRFKPSTAEIKQTEKRVLQDFKPERITRIVVQRQIREGDTGRVERVENYEIEKETLGWKMVKPVNFPVNTPMVRQLLDNIKKMDRHRSIGGADYENMNRDQTGLNNPDIIATFDTPETSVVLRVGAQVPMGWEYYAELKGRRQAYFIPNQMRDFLCFETDSSDKDVRRRLVFDVSPEYVNAVQMVVKGREMDFRRGRDMLSWFMHSPVYDRADDKRLGDLVKDLSKISVQEYVEQPRGGVDFKYDVTLVQRENSQRLQITDVITEPPCEDYDEPRKYCLARRTEYGQYFTLDPKVLENFSEDSDSYRCRTLLAPGVFEDLDYLVLDDGQSKLDMYYDKQEGHWELSSLLTTLKDELAIEDYAFLWLDLPIQGFADPATARAALQDRFMNIRVRYQGSDQMQDYALSKARDGLMYLERLSNVFVTVSADKVEALHVTNSFRFLTRQVVNLPEDEVSRIELSGAAGAMQLDWGTNYWLATEGGRTRQITPVMKDEILRRMPVLLERYVKEIEDSEKAAYGLDSPYLKIVFTMKDGETLSLSLGGECGSGRYALKEDQPYVFVLNAQTCQGLLQLLELGRLYRE